MSFIRYGNYPVDLTTGVPAISIPVYEIKTPRTRIPITVNYHAGGFKPAKYMGILGLGWSLSANYMISRVVQGDADETAPFPDPFKLASAIQPWVQSDYDYLNNINLPANYLGAKDAEYDIFYYNLPSGSGKFILKNIGNNKKAPVTIPYRPIRITSNAPDFNADFHTFEITDEDGVTYRFGKSIDGLYDHYEETRTPRGPGTFKTGWFMTSIISADRSDTVQFKYTGTFQQKQPAEDTYTLEDEFNQIPQNPIVCSGCSVPQGTQTSLRRLGASTSYYSATISEILYRHGRIVFSYITPSGSNDEQLSAVRVYNGSNEILQEIIPVISFYPQNAPYFKLDELQFKSQGETQKYGFTYNTSHTPPSYGPLITALDHWGFYNGRTSNQTLLVDHELVSNGVVYHTGSANRESDEEMMKVYMLNKITYPTGGTTEFEFEANRIEDGVLSNGRIVGGLRIRQIINNSGAGNINKKYYKYGLNESGKGNLVLNPELSRLIRYTTNSVNCGECPNYTSLVRSVSSEFTDGSGLFETGPVFYPHVTEYIGEGNEVLGKTAYFFEEPSNAYSGNPFFNYLSVVHSWTGNNLLEKTVFKKDENGFTPVEKEINVYVKRQTEALKGLKVIPDLMYPASVFDVWTHAYQFGKQASIFRYSEYTITSGVALLQERKMINYTEGATLESTQLYTYGTSHNNPLEISTLTSKGDKKINIAKYPADYPLLTGANDFSKGVKLLKDRNIINPLIENIQFTYHGTATNPSAVEAVLYGYKPQVPQLDGVWSARASSSSVSFVPSFVSADKIETDASYQQELYYPRYDTKSNILERKNRNGIMEVFVWGYESSFPVARLQNTTFDIVSSLINVSSLQFLTGEPLKQQLDILRTIPGCLAEIYTYTPNLGITSETNPSGNVTRYEYDNFQRLKVVRDKDDKILKVINYKYFGQ